MNRWICNIKKTGFQNVGQENSDLLRNRKDAGLKKEKGMQKKRQKGSAWMR